jgi:hypothetical protein
LQKTGRGVGWGLVGGEKAPTAKIKKEKESKDVTENLKSNKIQRKWRSENFLAPAFFVQIFII